MQQTRLDRLLEMIKEEPNDSFLKYAIATELIKLEEPQKALSYFLDLVASDPNYVGVYYHLAKLYEALNDRDKAAETYETGMLLSRKLGDNHAYSELHSAFRSFNGLDYDDE